MKRAVLIRASDNRTQTLGHLFLFDGLDIIFSCCTLELPYKNNERNISCIPTGNYKAVPRNSKKYNDHYIIDGVDFRDYILIHPANYYTQLKGCIGIGKAFYDINNDGEMDITSSRDTLASLLNYAPEGFTLYIINNNG